MATDQAPQSSFMQFLSSPGGAAAIGGVGSLFGGLAGLIGGQSQLEKLQEQLLQQQLSQSGINFGRRGELFSQLQGLIGQPIISPTQHSVLFNRATLGDRQSFLRSQTRGPGGISSQAANASFAFGTAGAKANSFLNFIRQGANRDVGILGIGSGLTRG